MKRSIKTEEPICNLCGGKSFEIVWDQVKTWEYDEVFQIVVCTKCKLRFLSPRPKREFIGAYYPPESYWGNDVSSAKQVDFLEKTRENSYGCLYNFIQGKRKGSIFDIGAGTGMFLSHFKELGWDVSGVEFSIPAVKYAKEMFGVNLKAGDFLDFNFSPKKYDVVTLNNSLEHLYNPQETLKAVYNITKKNGIVLITVPNVESLGAHLFGKKWYALTPPRHLYHFSPETLKKMLQEAGFEVMHVYHGYWIHNFYTVFESFRFIFSPKFKNDINSRGGNPLDKEDSSVSITNEIGKLFFKLLAFGIAKVGQAMRRGEVMVVYAKK